MSLFAARSPSSQFCKWALISVIVLLLLLLLLFWRDSFSAVRLSPMGEYQLPRSGLLRRLRRDRAMMAAE